ncbi:MAG: outer membrane lipid asymmetry maintenance protein MlaD [Nevskiaceae bacterium]|nr:MAG: outer membrane lipid asymmetry maintenance protein MlaD [Nevskiaceae bacterium]TBR74441.1 MAG: outer membrane lipid asymmetry maintenance protein MlaD [Nevskiaceae bacterium]
MQSRALEILVGFFVCLGVAAIFVLTFRVASTDNIGGGGGYTLTADFSNIGSLSPGASVKLAGVRIGSVTGISIDPKTFQAVVAMRISDQHRDIPDDSAAKILTAGLLGEQYVGLEPGGSLDALKDGGRIQFTQSAFVLENVIGQFLTGMVQKGSQSSGSPGAAPAPATP